MGLLIFAVIILMSLVMMFGGKTEKTEIECPYQRMDKLQNRVDSRLNQLKNGGY